MNQLNIRGARYVNEMTALFIYVIFCVLPHKKQILSKTALFLGVFNLVLHTFMQIVILYTFSGERLKCEFCLQKHTIKSTSVPYQSLHAYRTLFTPKTSHQRPDLARDSSALYEAASSCPPITVAPRFTWEVSWPSSKRGEGTSTPSTGS